MNKYIIAACVSLVGCVYIPTITNDRCDSDGHAGSATSPPQDAGADADADAGEPCVTCAQAMAGDFKGTINVCNDAVDAWFKFQVSACATCVVCEPNLCHGFVMSGECAACVAQMAPNAMAACKSQ